MTSPSALLFPSSTLVTLTLDVTDADWANQFTHIEVFRSRSTAEGPYEELTGSSWGPARLPLGALPPPNGIPPGPNANVNGKTFLVQLGSQVYSVTLAGTDPQTLRAIAQQITTALPTFVFCYVQLDGTFAIQTVQPGTVASLLLPPSDVSAILGLPTLPGQNEAHGIDPRLPLFLGTTRYTYTDQQGSPDYFYKVRYVNAFTGVAGDYSQPYSLPQSLGISPANVIQGTLSLVDVDGTPRDNCEVVVYSAMQGMQVEGKTIVSNRVVKATDENGLVSFSLVRGSTVRMAISSTAIAREIVVPIDPTVTSFDLLDGRYGTDDASKVAIPNYDYAQRRSL